MKNQDLQFDIDKILWIQESIETDLTKLAVNTAEDFNLDYPYAIDVEDFRYFYTNEYERDEDYDKLVLILNSNSNKYFYH